MQNNKGKIKVESTAKKKQNPYKNDILWTPEGQFKYPGQVTRIPSSNISMDQVPYPVFGIGSSGYSQMMYPDHNYKFPNSSYVDEFPMLKRGGTPKLGQIYDRLGRLHSIKDYVPFARSGGQPSPAKALEMLHNPPHGKPLSNKQRKYFGYLSSLKNGGYNPKDMSNYNNFKGRKMPFPQIQTEQEFFSPFHANIESPYDHGSFRMGGFPTFPVFPTQPTMKQISSYGRPTYPVIFAQDGGQNSDVYNATMEAMGTPQYPGSDYVWPMAPGAPFGPFNLPPNYGGSYPVNQYSIPANAPMDYSGYTEDTADEFRYGGSKKKKKKKPCYMCMGGSYKKMHGGGQADINQGPEFFTNKQNTFTEWLRGQAMDATMNDMSGMHQMPDGSMMPDSMMRDGGSEYQVGRAYNVSDLELENLKKQGYKLRVV